jgi:hypothetical protein
MAMRCAVAGAGAHDAAFEAFTTGLHIDGLRAAFVLHGAGGNQHRFLSRAGIQLRLGGHAEAQVASGLANSKIAGTVRVLASTMPPTAISRPFFPPR